MCSKYNVLFLGVNVFLFQRPSRDSQPCAPSPWAVKKMKGSRAREDIAKRLEREAKILKSINHPNIIGYR